jgi:hypothetical protein
MMESFSLGSFGVMTFGPAAVVVVVLVLAVVVVIGVWVVAVYCSWP